MAKHAFLSASGAPAWSRCEAKVWREVGLPDESSAYAEEGTLAHELLERCLPKRSGQAELEPKEFPVEMYDQVQKTLALVYPFLLKDDSEVRVFSEQQLDISWITTEINATGTADVVILNKDELVIIDLKYGMGVEVDAVENEQLLIYGAAALREFDLVGDIKTLKMIISQPRLDAVSEWILPVAEVWERIKPLTRKAIRILSAKGGDDLHATPGEKQCKFCKVKGTCPDYRGSVLTVVTDDFVDLDQEDAFLEKVRNAELRLQTSDDKHLATCMDAVDMIENWCKAVRGQVEKRLLNGSFSDPRYKLVQGKRGNRKWIHEDAVLEAFPFERNLYEQKLKSPVTLEKEWKDRPESIEVLRTLVTQSEGKPSVAPASDKRPVLNMELEFKDLDKEDMEYVDSLAGLTKD